MAYRFAPGVYACRADGHLVVLNTHADRYLLLPPEGDASVTRLIQGEPDRPGDQELRTRLCTKALVLERSLTGAPSLCDHPFPERSMLDQGWTSPGLRGLTGAAVRTACARVAVRHVGLARLLRRLVKVRGPNTGDPDQAEQIAASFASLRLAIPALDRCLPLSIALAASAKRQHAQTRLVLGVKCNPFGAHAWVELESMVLNDRLDTVRPFTPILAL